MSDPIFRKICENIFQNIVTAEIFTKHAGR